MTNALTIHTDEPAAITRPAAAPVDFGALWQMAGALVPTGMLPDWIKTPGQACAIILAGQELGMAPMRALRSLQMVKGKVTESADSQLARFKSDGGRAVFETLTETEAVLRLRHPNGDEHVETFTLEDARKAGLAGQGGMYQKYPKAMLRSRAITAGLKSIGWEGGSGVYDPSELPAFEAPRPVADAQASATEDAMTLERALALPLLGKPQTWGDQAGKPLGTLSPRLLTRAQAFFREKYQENENPRVLEQLQAIALVLPVREAEDAGANYSGGMVPPGGKVVDALELTSPDAAVPA